MHIIDFHTHYFPDELAPRAIATLLENTPENELFTDGTSSGLQASMAKHHINQAVILPVATKPSQVDVINQHGLPAQHDCFIQFGALHPQTVDIDSVVLFLKKNGLKGVKLHPEYQHFYLDDPQHFPLFEALSGAGLITVVHAGSDPGPFSCDHALPIAFKTIQANFPRLTLVAAHMGGWQMWEEVRSTLCGTPLYMDTAAVAGHMDPDLFVEIARKQGCDKILFGSDSPWFDQGAAVRWIELLPLTDHEKELIFAANALHLLGLNRG